MSEKQQTLAKEVSVSGTGIHHGKSVSVKMTPASVDTGIVFIRTDLPTRPTISLRSGPVLDIAKSVRRTTITKDGVELQTVEHFMAALWGVGIDNAYVEVSGIELPGVDGSAAPFVKKIREAGIVEQDSPRRCFTPKEPILVEEGDASIAVFPDKSLRVSYMLNYDHSFLRSQFAAYNQNDDTFDKEIAPARTFCFQAEADLIRAEGLGKGATFENTLVIGDKGVIDNKLRFDDEFARHKILDLIGDLYLLGSYLKARVIAIKSGHSLNMKLLLKLKQTMEGWNPGAFQANAKEIMVGPQLDIMQIQKILPHRYPFLLVDRVTELSETRAVGTKGVTINDPFFQGHFPGHPIMPGVLIVEAMAQVSGIIMLNKEANRGKIAYFMSVDKVKFRQPVVPGDVLVLEVELTRMRARTGQAKGRALVDGKVVCEAELMFALSE